MLLSGRKFKLRSGICLWSAQTSSFGLENVPLRVMFGLVHSQSSALIGMILLLVPAAILANMMMVALRLLISRVDVGNARIVIDRFSIHRFDDGNIIRDARHVWQQFAKPSSILTVLREFEFRWCHCQTGLT